jgi:hypothetical protein
MKKVLSLTILALGMSLSPALFANEKVPERAAHYQGKQASDLNEAIANLKDGNARLKELLAGKVGEYDMHDIHSLSYTLEEAVARLRDELATVADELESMHFYSEGLKREEVIKHGNAYLEGIERFVK